MKKLILLTLFAGLGTVMTWGQNNVIFSHFMFNKLAYNPAFAGIRGGLEANAIYRNQWWSGIEGAPESINLSFHKPFGNGKNGLGLSLNSDNIGFYKNASADLIYAYKLRFKNHTALSIGLQGRVEYSRTDWAEASGLDAVDNQLGVGQLTKVRPNFGAGIFYNTPSYYLGLSTPILLKNSFYEDYNQLFEADHVTMYLMWGMITKLNESVKLYPSVLVSLNANAPVDLDLNLNFLIMESVWAGVSYRWEDSIDAILQYQFKNGFRAGMAFDFTASELSKATNGSFELLFGYQFQCADCEVVNLRYF